MRWDTVIVAALGLIGTVLGGGYVTHRHADKRADTLRAQEARQQLVRDAAGNLGTCRDGASANDERVDNRSGAHAGITARDHSGTCRAVTHLRARASTARRLAARGSGWRRRTRRSQTAHFDGLHRRAKSAPGSYHRHAAPSAHRRNHPSSGSDCDANGAEVAGSTSASPTACSWCVQPQGYARFQRELAACSRTSRAFTRDPPDTTLSAVIGTATAAAPADNRNISRRDQYDMMTHFRSRHSVRGFARGVKMADSARLNTYFAQRG